MYASDLVGAGQIHFLEALVQKHALLIEHCTHSSVAKHYPLGKQLSKSLAFLFRYSH